jgi:hypothetical protein
MSVRETKREEKKEKLKNFIILDKISKFKIFKMAANGNKK